MQSKRTTRSGRVSKQPERFVPTMHDDGTPSWDEYEVQCVLKELDELSELSREDGRVDSSNNDDANNCNSEDDAPVNDNDESEYDSDDVDYDKKHLSASDQSDPDDENEDVASSESDAEVNKEDDELFAEDPMLSDTDLEKLDNKMEKRWTNVEVRISGKTNDDEHNNEDDDNDSETSERPPKRRKRANKHPTTTAKSTESHPSRAKSKLKKKYSKYDVSETESDESTDRKEEATFSNAVIIEMPHGERDDIKSSDSQIGEEEDNKENILPTKAVRIAAPKRRRHHVQVFNPPANDDNNNGNESTDGDGVDDGDGEYKYEYKGASPIADKFGFNTMNDQQCNNATALDKSFRNSNMYTTPVIISVTPPSSPIHDPLQMTFMDTDVMDDSFLIPPNDPESSR